MTGWRNNPSVRTALLCAAICIFAIPALGQDSPESLLPPGFGSPEPAQPPADPGTPEPSPPNTAPGAATSQPTDAALDENGDATDEEANADALSAYALPERLGRSLETVGPLTAENGGYDVDAFGNARGRFLTSLMYQVRAPVASRWVSIALRRGLLSHVTSPSGVDQADWVAARAWMLLRMGEVDAARMLINAVDPDRYTRNMLSVALQGALAGADPAGLCPLIETARPLSDETAWTLAEAMCAALAGEPGTATAILDRVRTANRGARTIDQLLAEKVVGAGINGRRAVTIEWDRVDRLTAWRFGLASATAVEIPARLMASVGPHVAAWQARAPFVGADQRLAFARTATRLGVFSGRALIDSYSQFYDASDVEERAASLAGTLRSAYTGADRDARLAAMRQIWTSGDGSDDVYVNQLMTAYAAARIQPDADLIDDAPQLVAAMCATGLDRQAARWSRLVEPSGGSSERLTWGILAVCSPRATASYDAVNDYAGGVGASGRQKSRMLVAALAGLGRLSPAEVTRLQNDLGFSIVRQSRWSETIARAGRSRQPATVALLAAAGMQSTNWANIPPAHLFSIVSAFRMAGQEPTARMIAAEAISRL